jgi:hypothetical protein
MGSNITDKEFREMLAGLHIKQYFASVEHPQSNGQAESANKVILTGLRKHFEKAEASWTENLYQVFWSYRTTPHSTTGETPFIMCYGTNAVIPVEIGQPFWRVMYPAENNEQLFREDSDLVDEVREIPRIKELSRKQQIAQRYNLKVVKRNFQTSDLVMRRASIGNRNARDGKLKANWEAHTGSRRQLQEEHTIWKPYKARSYQGLSMLPTCGGITAE